MIGYIAACLTTFGFLPQMIKVLKTKDVEYCLIVYITYMKIYLISKDVSEEFL